MLKRKEYIYETNDYKIINPNKELADKINNQLTMKYQNKDGIIDFDNEEFNFYLFKLLIEYINKEFDFKKYSYEEFNDVLSNPSQEIETIAYYIGSIVSDIIINDLRKKQLEIKMANIELLQNIAVNSLESFKLDIIQAENNSKTKIGEQELDKNIQVKKLNKLQQFLYKHDLIK
jgi:hypothetical protein